MTLNYVTLALLALLASSSSSAARTARFLAGQNATLPCPGVSGVAGDEDGAVLRLWITKDRQVISPDDSGRVSIGADSSLLITVSKISHFKLT